MALGMRSPGRTAVVDLARVSVLNTGPAGGDGVHAARARMARPLVVARGAPSDRPRHTGEFTHKSAEIGTMHSARLARSQQARAACEQSVTLALRLSPDRRRDGGGSSARWLLCWQGCRIMGLSHRRWGRQKRADPVARKSLLAEIL